MEDGDRDSTQDWLLPERAAPATIAELEDRIDFAIAIARSSEAAVMTVADAAIDSAEQALRAAELAERAAAAAARGGPRNGFGNGPQPPSEEKWLISFSRRADLLGARFAELQRR